MIPFLTPISTERELTIEQAIVVSIKLQEPHAMEQLYKNYASCLYGIVFKMVKNDEQSEDILQDVFIKIWRNISQYDQSKGRLFTWMANVTRNTAIDYLRSKAASNSKKTSDITELHVSQLDHASCWANIDTIGLKNLLASLKADQQEILELFYFQGLTHVQVAEELLIPIGTVKTKIRQAILALRRIFNEPALMERRA